MSEKRIASIGCEIPGGYSEYLTIDSKASLLDWDIILFSLDISSLLGSRYDHFQGKRSLTEYLSFQLHEHFDHWRREIIEATHLGKLVIVFLDEYFEFYVDTGKREHSGTGRNRQTTRMLSLYDNYKCLPFDIKPVASSGTSMQLAKESEILANYWAAFGNKSTYKVYMQAQVGKPLIVTKAGEKVVSSIVRSADSSGSLLLLPFIDLSRGEFFRENKKGENEWTKKAEEFGAHFMGAIIEIDKALRSSGTVTPVPDWANSVEYELPKEVKIRKALLDVDGKIDDLQKQKRLLHVQLTNEGILRRLLFEKGHILEEAILLALKTLGFSASHYKENASEFDAVFESSEGRFLGEVEGKDNSAIGIEKLRQLEMNILEDLQREEVKEPAKGVLFGNAYRLLPVKERGRFFTEKCLSAAQRSGTALVRTSDLFFAAQYLTEEPDETYAQECRRLILETKGEMVVFPERPDYPVKAEELKEAK